jgi:hypothetical protein
MVAPGAAALFLSQSAAMNIQPCTETHLPGSIRMVSPGAAALFLSLSAALNTYPCRTDAHCSMLQSLAQTLTCQDLCEWWPLLQLH